MRLCLRVSLVLAASSLSCVGGPVSDWPAKGHDDPGSDDGDTPTPAGTGTNSGAAMDAGLSAPTAPPESGSNGSDAGSHCAPDASACRSVCVDAAAPALTDPTAHARIGCSDSSSLSD